MQSDTSGNLLWAASGSGGGSGAVSSGTAGSVAFYNTTGTTVSGSSALQIATSGTAVSSYAHLDVKTGNDLRVWNSGNTFYTAIGAGNNASNYTLLLPTAPVGAGASVIVTGSDGLQYFAAPGPGIAFSSATANTPLIRAKRPIYMTFCAGYTPITTGADSVVLRVPHSPSDGTTSVTYRPQEIHIRVETPSAGTSTIILEKYTGTSAFSGTAITTISVSGAALYEIDHSFAAGIFFTSTDKLRLNFSALNSTHQGFSVYVEMEEV